MNRRDFFKLAGMAAGAAAAQRLWPFRTYSFPSPRQWTISGPWAAAGVIPGDVLRSLPSIEIVDIYSTDLKIHRGRFYKTAHGEYLPLGPVRDTPSNISFFQSDGQEFTNLVRTDKHAPLDRVYLLPKRALQPPPEPVWHEGPPQIEAGLFDYLEGFKDQMAMLTGVGPIQEGLVR